MHETLARLRSSSFLRQGALVFAASTFLNAAGFVFHMIASRSLGVDQYGTLAALISAMTLAAAPTAVLMPVITRFAAEFRALDDFAHLRGLSVGLARAFGAVALIVIAATLIGANTIGALMNAPAWSVALAGTLLAVVLASGAYRALAQGIHDFEGFAYSAIAEGAAKIVATLVFAVVGWKLFGALAGFFVGSLAGCALIMQRVFAVALRYPEEPVRYDWRRIVVAGAGSLALTVAIALLGNADVVMVKHWFDASQAGIYSAASLVGKIFLFGFGFIPVVLLPQAADRHARGEHTRVVLFAGLAAVGVLGGLGLVVFKLFGLVLLHALVGAKFDAAQPLLMWYGAAMIFASLINILGSYGIATHRLAFGVPALLGSVGTIVALNVYHPTLVAVASVLAVGCALTAVVSAVAIAIQGLVGSPTREAP